MLGKILRKAVAPAKESPPVAPGDRASAAAETAQWEGRLHAAAGDDDALLALAREAPLLVIKHAAVLALASEDALKRAEREFRSGNRRVYRAAKQRYEASVARRLARERAGSLIDAATALSAESMIPANHLVELDHAWKALDLALLEEVQLAQRSEEH